MHAIFEYRSPDWTVRVYESGEYIDGARGEGLLTVERWLTKKYSQLAASTPMPSTWPVCVVCGAPAGWTVGWLAPHRADDIRPCCSSRCANAAAFTVAHE